VQTAAQQRAVREAREAVAREARRRREAARLLAVIASTSGYASHQLSNGLSPQQAKRATAEAADELEAAADRLRMLLRSGLHQKHELVQQRRQTARRLADAGVGRAEIARRLGVCERTAWRYAGRSA
jgi:hypothetical protein